jgi:hypothetical protein
MTRAPIKENIAPSMIRRLARDNQEMGKRLAQLEFREMLVELSSPELFDLNIDFDSGTYVAPPMIPSIFNEPDTARLKPLNAGLGRITWAGEPDALPVVGVFCGDIDLDHMRSSLKQLLTAHHQAPFARFVFCCATLRPVPFLGRYGFAIEHLGSTTPLDAAPRLKVRFGMTQLRDLVGATVLWQAHDID